MSRTHKHKRRPARKPKRQRKCRSDTPPWHIKKMPATHGDPVHTSSFSVAMPKSRSWETEILYEPSSALVTYDWQGPLDVLRHLLRSFPERESLRQQARCRSRHSRKRFIVHHHLLGQQLYVHALDSDQKFVARIGQLKTALEWYDGTIRHTPSLPSHQTQK